MANDITSCRILCSIAMVFFLALSSEFFILYVIAGFTDMVDGAVARKTNTVSEFGSKLDTIADFVFVVICFAKLIPIFDLPTWIWIWVGMIAMIKVINVFAGFAIHKRFVAQHTIMNKLTGGLLFLYPLILPYVDRIYGALVVCVFATFAAIQEGYCLKTARGTDEKCGVVKQRKLKGSYYTIKNEISYRNCKT